MITEKQNSAFYWATIFLRELHANGVTHLVISPGSRSTPLTLAAAAHPGFETHIAIDERSAAFIALGITKQTGIPAGLICTSGTAVANYFPAVVESRHSGVPIIVLSADRPPNLRNSGASQAVDQIKMFGDYPVYFHEAGEPILETSDLKRLRMAASQSVNASKKHRGPAHVNFPFRKPLEPGTDFVEQIERENRAQIDDLKRPQIKVFDSTESTLLDHEIRKLISSAKRPVVIQGPTGVKPFDNPAAEIAELLNVPFLTEFPHLSHPNSLNGFDGYLKSEQLRAHFKPDLIIRFGLQPVSKALHLYLQEHDEVPHIHFSDLDEWQDATHSVTHRVEWPGNNINWKIKGTNTDSEWLENWLKTDRQFENYKKTELNSVNKLTEGHVFYSISEQIPEEYNVFLSNSFPVRDWMLFAGSPPHPTFVNRGASGIDGVLSTAVGTSIASGKPGALFIGDLATLHDSNALLSSKLLKVPLIVFILNNGGGNIFRMLPIFQHKKLYTGFFETPQQVNFEYLAKFHGIYFKSIHSIRELDEIELSTFDEPGIHLIECQTDSDASMQLRYALWNYSG